MQILSTTWSALHRRDYAVQEAIVVVVVAQAGADSMLWRSARGATNAGATEVIFKWLHVAKQAHKAERAKCVGVRVCGCVWASCSCRRELILTPQTLDKMHLGQTMDKCAAGERFYNKHALTHTHTHLHSQPHPWGANTFRWCLTPQCVCCYVCVCGAVVIRWLCACNCY